MLASENLHSALWLTPYIPRKHDGAMKTFMQNRREELGMTQEEMAEKLGTSAVNVSRWERGLVQIPDRRKPLIAAVLKCRPSDLLNSSPSGLSEPAAPAPVFSGSASPALPDAKQARLMRQIYDIIRELRQSKGDGLLTEEGIDHLALDCLAEGIKYGKITREYVAGMWVNRGGGE